MKSAGFLPPRIEQIAIVVADIKTTAAAWASALGVDIPEIKETEGQETTHALHLGQPLQGRAKLAFFHLENLTLELIEPIGRPSVWGDDLDRKGDDLHHIAFRVDDRAQTASNLERSADATTEQTGDFTGGGYHYLRSRKLGALLELLQID